MNNSEQNNNSNVAPVYGSDITALNSIIPSGTRAAFPSPQTNIVTNIPVAQLGQLRIADQLLLARERGIHRDGELALAQHTYEYSYTGIFTEQYGGDIHFRPLPGDVANTYLKYNRNRYTSNSEAMMNVVRAFDDSAMRNSQFTNYLFTGFAAGGDPAIVPLEMSTNTAFLGRGGYLNNDEENAGADLGNVTLSPQLALA